MGDVGYKILELDVFFTQAKEGICDLLLREDSPVYIDKDFFVFGRRPGTVGRSGGNPCPGGVCGFEVTGVRYAEDLIAMDINKELYGWIGFVLQEAPASCLYTDNSPMSPGVFIPQFKPVLDYFRSNGVPFCVVGLDEDLGGGIIGVYDGASVIKARDYVIPEFLTLLD